MAEVNITDILMGLKEKIPDLEAKPRQTKEYNPHKHPPDFEMAINHGRAKRVYKRIDIEKLEDEEEGPVCGCCGLPIVGEQLPLNCNLKELYHLGCGYALYFKYIKYCITLMMIILCVSGLYNLFTNVMGDDCEDEGDYCSVGIILSYTIANKRDEFNEIKIQLILNSVSLILVMIFLHYIRLQIRKTIVQADAMTVTPADYTVVLKRIEPTITDEQLKEWLEQMATEEHPIKVVRIVRAYDIREYVLLRKRKVELKNHREMVTSAQELKDTEDELEEVRKKLVHYKEGGLKHADVVYVTFNLANQSDYVRMKFIKGAVRKTFDYFISLFWTSGERINDKKVKAKRAPEPTDILWENVGYTPREKFMKRILTNSVTAVLIIFSFVLIGAVNYAQDVALQKSGQTTFLRLMSFLASLLIYGINTILSITIVHLSDYEKHGTYTGYYTGIAKKLSVSIFINTAFTTLIAKIFIAIHFSKSDDLGDKIQEINFFGEGGLLENIFFVVITGSFLAPFLDYFDPTYFMKKIEQRLALRKKENSELSQREAHRLFEGTHVDMPSKYAYLVKTMLLAAFYAPALPFVLVITIIGLILAYWADKYILLRRNALPNSLGDDLTKMMVEYIEWMPFMYASGNIMFTYILESSDNEAVHDKMGAVLMWLTLILSLFNLISPMEVVNENLFKVHKESVETKSFNKVKAYFGTDYDIENPITRKSALRKLVAKSKGKKEEEPLHNIHGNFIKSVASDILRVVDTHTKADDEHDLSFLNAYAQRVKQKPIREIELAPEEVLNDYQIDYRTFMGQLGDLITEKTQGIKTEEEKPQEDESSSKIEEEGPEGDEEKIGLLGSKGGK